MLVHALNTDVAFARSSMDAARVEARIAYSVGKSRLLHSTRPGIVEML